MGPSSRPAVVPGQDHSHIEEAARDPAHAVSGSRESWWLFSEVTLGGERGMDPQVPRRLEAVPRC